MAFQPIPDVARVVTHGYTVDPARSWTFTLHFYRTAFTFTDLEQLATDVESDLLGGLVGMSDPLLLDAFHFTQVVAYDLSAVDAPKVIVPSTKVGTGTTAPASISNAIVLTMNSQGRGKWNQNRVFLPFVDEAHADSRSVDTDLADNVQGVFNATLLAPPITGWTWVVVSRYLNRDKRPEGVWSQVISAVVRNRTFGTQKRRLRRG